MKNNKYYNIKFTGTVECYIAVSAETEDEAIKSVENELTGDGLVLDDASFLEHAIIVDGEVDDEEIERLEKLEEEEYADDFDDEDDFY